MFAVGKRVCSLGSKAKRSPVSVQHPWERRALCSAGHQLVGVSLPLSAAGFGKGVKPTVIDGVVPHCT